MIRKEDFISEDATPSLIHALTSLLWDRKARSAAVLAQALAVIDHGASWSNKQQHPSTIDAFLRKHPAVFDEIPALAECQGTRYMNQFFVCTHKRSNQRLLEIELRSWAEPDSYP